MAQVEYDGAHSITFGDGSLTSDGKFAGMNTWTNWHLVPSSRPTMPMPGFATKYIEIPGRDGTIDLSEFLVKRPVYGDRSGSFEFYVDNTKEKDWIGLYRRIATYLHGKRMKMCLTGDDPEYYYEGRFSLNEWASDQNWSRIVINYQVGPYKKALRVQGAEDIIWDNFNFNTDYHWYVVFSDLEVTTTKRFTMPGSDYPYSIHAACTDGTVTVSFNGDTKTFTAGEDGNVGLASLMDGTLTISGNGHVTLSYREGSL